MVDPKALVFVTLAVGSTAAFLLVRNKPWEERFLKRAVVTATLVKLVGCVLVYVFWPSLIQHSDARQFYLPQTLDLLSGKLRNKDIPTPRPCWRIRTSWAWVFPQTKRWPCGGIERPPSKALPTC